MAITQQGQGSNLENICSYSFPANHLLQLSLVRQPIEEGSYKKAHFFFITLAPGEQSQTGRTFNFQNRINMKVEGHKMAEFAAALRAAAAGQDSVMGKFQQYVDSSKSQFGGNAGGKSMMVASGQDPKTQARNVGIFFKAGQGSPVTFGATPYAAIAIAKVIDAMVDKFLELELEKSVQGTYSNPSFSQPPSGQINPNTPQFNHPSQAPPADPFTSNPGQVMGNFANKIDDFGDAPF
jgi:hypothetical protein